MTATAGFRGGSSPHTRGLPHGRPATATAIRIIPAHAGFTGSSLMGYISHPDHPRTRGVYGRGPGQLGDVAGSSPHTRGLPRQRVGGHTERRIIPAHAGFTLGELALYRGEHGSSPHTRGLQPRTKPIPTRSRIIPAHAGFTLYMVLLRGCGGDHPRTRGVYGSVSRLSLMRLGSSPHTRGLRPGPRVQPDRGRIIPAHAGFTLRWPARRRPAWDHPRTRGVYVDEVRDRDGSEGSSPHTRGLRVEVAGGGGELGIIPAHAGFTGRQRGPRARVRDHPRTRGVYMTASLALAGNAGSSPHTRGLPTRPSRIPVIPRDHPRTRGVYLKWGFPGAAERGSSPHTRGLRRTSTSCRRPSGDHPRTRGVYGTPITAAELNRRIIPAHAGFTHDTSRQ